MVTFSISQIIAAFLAVCGGIAGFGAAVAVVTGWIKQAKSPELAQNERISKLEAITKKHEEMLSDDSYRIKSIEQGNRITQKAILALLSHGIDGNDVDAMKESKKELQEYLINTR